MTLAEILQSLRDNGHSFIANVVEFRATDEGLLDDVEGTKRMYGEMISSYLEDPKPLDPEEVILSPEFAYLRAVANLMLTYIPMELELSIEEVSIDLTPDDIFYDDGQGVDLAI